MRLATRLPLLLAPLPGRRECYPLAPHPSAFGLCSRLRVVILRAAVAAVGQRVAAAHLRVSKVCSTGVTDSHVPAVPVLLERDAVHCPTRTGDGASEGVGGDCAARPRAPVGAARLLRLGRVYSEEAHTVGASVASGDDQRVSVHHTSGAGEVWRSNRGRRRNQKQSQRGATQAARRRAHGTRGRRARREGRKRGG